MTRTIRKTTSLPLAIIGGIADHAHDFGAIHGGCGVPVLSQLIYK